MKIDDNILNKISLLEEKYGLMGQDINSYLEGLLLSNYLTYWDYVQVETLLTLQRPRTDFPDEQIFIIYHQITELYFKLCLHELEQLGHNGLDITGSGKNNGWREQLDPEYFIQRVTRVNRYFEALTKSFDIMVDGMEKEQFLKYRMALLPASGFQSAQYRMIEISCTDFINLVDKDKRKEYQQGDHSVDELFQFIYWNKGATEVATGKKTLTLEQFEKKYAAKFIQLAKEYKTRNLWQKYLQLDEKSRNDPRVKNVLKELDVNVNVNWPLVHYKSAVRYLQQKEGDVPATGGTNWQKYLPPRFQRRVFYPELWSENELQEWGKGWVETNVFRAGR